MAFLHIWQSRFSIVIKVYSGTLRYEFNLFRDRVPTEIKLYLKWITDLLRINITETYLEINPSRAKNYLLIQRFQFVGRKIQEYSKTSVANYGNLTYGCTQWKGTKACTKKRDSVLTKNNKIILCESKG